MARLQRARFDKAEDVRNFDHGRMEVVQLDDRIVGRSTLDPGWRWATDVKPIAGTDWCEFHHVGVMISGRLRVQMSDGLELDIGPGELYEIPTGHDAWVLGDEPSVSIALESLYGYGIQRPSEGRRSLASILLSDIVDSTARAVALGPARWRERVNRHNQLSERLIEVNGGRLVKTTGDGVIGLFDTAEGAVRAAVALPGALAPLELQVRVAVHGGEVEFSGADVRGVAVHVAARIAAVAAPGDVIVSSTTRELVEGSTLEFDDFGRHELKGLPGERQLYKIRLA